MPGPWTTVDRLADPDSEYADEAVAGASYILWMLTGRRYSGVADTVETYCQEKSADYIWIGDIYPDLVYGDVRNIIAGKCTVCGGCAHTVRLRGTPIIQIHSVRRGDELVPLEQVSVIDRARIAPAAPGVCWGGCDDVTVSYRYGSPPPVAGVHAATELANQFIWARTDDARCRLPERITGVSRQGVSWTVLDQQDFLENGRTGLYIVDLFLKTANPDNARMPARVFSVDTPKARTVRSAASMSGRGRRTPPSAPF